MCVCVYIFLGVGYTKINKMYLSMHTGHFNASFNYTMTDTYVRCYDNTEEIHPT